MQEHINKQINNILGLAKYLEDKANTLKMEYSVNGVVVETLVSDLTKTKEFSTNIFNRLLQENQTILDKLKELEAKNKEVSNEEIVTTQKDFADKSKEDNTKPVTADEPVVKPVDMTVDNDDFDDESDEFDDDEEL